MQDTSIDTQHKIVPLSSLIWQFLIRTVMKLEIVKHNHSLQVKTLDKGRANRLKIKQEATLSVEVELEAILQLHKGRIVYQLIRRKN